MRVLVLGSGAREHALCWRLALDPDVGACHLRAWQLRHRPHRRPRCRSSSTIPTPCSALAEPAEVRTSPSSAPRRRWPPAWPTALPIRVVRCSAPRGRPRNSRPARRSRRTSWRATACPTARYRVCHSADDALDVVRRRELGEAVVVKADGLAAGKGVVVAPDRDRRPKRPFEPRCSTGPLAMRARGSCSKSASPGPKSRTSSSPTESATGRCVTAQDHKRIFDGDRGPEHRRHGRLRAEPARRHRAAGAHRDTRSSSRCSAGMASEGTPFRGLPLLRADADRGRPEGDRVQRAVWRPRGPGGAAADRRAAGATAARGGEGRMAGSADRHGIGGSATGRRSQCAVGVVLAAKGYPGEVETGQRIEGLEHLAHEYPDVLAFFRGREVPCGREAWSRAGGARHDPGGPRPLLSRRAASRRVQYRRVSSRVAIRGDASSPEPRHRIRKALTNPAAAAPSRHRRGGRGTSRWSGLPGLRCR